MVEPLELHDAPLREEYDAVVVGSGPNGLAAAVAIAQAGRSVCVLEASLTIGGGTRTEESSLPGFQHDVCSAVHPLGLASPYLSSLPLAEHGLEWVHPEAPLAHSFRDAPAVIAEHSLEATCDALGDEGEGWNRLVGPFAARFGPLLEDVLAPVGMPRRPLLMGRFGLHAIRSAAGLSRARLRGPRSRALFAGIAAHCTLPLEQLTSAAAGLLLGSALHAGGWPVARGGSRAISEALGRLLLSEGGELVVGRRVRRLEELPQARAVLFDVSPRELLAIAGGALPPGYRRRLARWRYGPAAFKLDWALAGKIPWSDPACLRAATVHVGGTLEDVIRSERGPFAGSLSEEPFLIVSQQSLFDSSRAPEGKQTGWGYAHVPMGFSGDLTEVIEAQLERHAPGFRDLILARSVSGPAQLEKKNPNYVGGDISAGSLDLRQLFARPRLLPDPYRTPNRRLLLCSAATPPGPGVHGMCGYHAAQRALRGPLR